MKWQVSPSLVTGIAEVPGDKSIAHRALMLASLAAGHSEIDNLPNGEDVQSTARCMSALGASIHISDTTTHVEAPEQLREASVPLDAGNSGTTMRLLAGILAGQPFPSCLTGDASLSRRPMSRVVEPLKRMGADIRAEDGHAPLTIGPSNLRGIEYVLPVASAQVKSAVLLAGLFAEGTTRVVEPAPSRDHTERMLAALGVPVEREGDSVAIHGGAHLRPFSTRVPGDISSAAFLFAAAVLTGGEVTVRNVGMNPTRAALLAVLQRMGAAVSVAKERSEMGEQVADVTVSGSITGPLVVTPQEIAVVIDELPVLALLATQAAGTSTVRGAGELRVKETDRTELPDGFVIRGGTRLRGNTVSSFGDHRLAMMLAVAGAVADGLTTVEGAEAADISYPQFAATLAALGGRIEPI
jgi:3-phosphoshikimate 1-carboxyvinyltransferase